MGAYRKAHQPSRGIHVRLNEDLVRRLDESCDKYNISRAMILERALERHLDHMERMMERLEQISNAPDKEESGEQHPD